MVSGLLSSRKSRALVSQAWVARVFPRLVLVAYFPAHCPVAYFPALGLAPVYMLLPPILIGALGICVHDWSIIYSVLVRNLSILKRNMVQSIKTIFFSQIFTMFNTRKDDYRTKLFVAVQLKARIDE